MASVLLVAACTDDDSAGEGTASTEVALSTSSPVDDATVETTAATDPSSVGVGGGSVITDPSSPGPTAGSTDDITTSSGVDASRATLDPVPFSDLEVVTFEVPDGSRPHDVAPALDGGVWYTAQRSGELGYLDPESGATRHIPLGSGSSPHGVIVGPDGLAWVTDSGLNAIVSVDPATDEVATYPLPSDASDANLNTAAFDGAGRLWFTGQNGIYGVLDVASGTIEAYPAPRGRGPYGITATPEGQIYFASLAGSYIGLIGDDGSVAEIDPPTPAQGARRVWSDSTGAIWVSEWNSGQLSRFDPNTDQWLVWPLPGDDPAAYAVYVDGADQIWVSDFGGNAIHRFDPDTEAFETFQLPAEPSEVRQILGRGNEIWGAQSADDSLVVIRPASWSAAAGIAG
jgi:virginiamycin B lyase